MADLLARLGDAPFVLLTTFKKDGTGVGTPMWVVRDGDALVFWTPRESWKVRRTRRDPRVLLARCSRMGRVAEDEPQHEGAAVVVDDPAEVEAGREAMRRKYGWQLAVMTRLEAWFARGAKDRVLLRVTPGGVGPRG